jgi:hypothetical protein
MLLWSAFIFACRNWGCQRANGILCSLGGDNKFYWLCTAAPVPERCCEFTYPFPIFFFASAFHLAMHVYFSARHCPFEGVLWIDLVGTQSGALIQFSEPCTVQYLPFRIFQYLCSSENISSHLHPSRIVYPLYGPPHPTDSIAFTFPFRLLFHPESGDSKLLRNTATYLTRRRRIKKHHNFHITLCGNPIFQNVNEFVGSCITHGKTENTYKIIVIKINRILNAAAKKKTTTTQITNLLYTLYFNTSYVATKGADRSLAL